MLVTTNASISTSDAYHIKDAVDIYTYYFDNYKYHNLIDKGDLILTLPTKYGKEPNINIYALEDVKYYLNNTFNKEDIRLNYIGTDLITQKMEKGTKLGKIEIIYNNQLLETIDIYLPYKIDFSFFKFLKENIIYVVASVLITLVLVIIIVKSIKHKN